MSALDIINANGQDYDIMSPEVVSDYVEKIGTICKNPNGYTKGSLFLARDAQNVERMYKATSAIASNQTITSGTNCTVKKLGDLFNDVDSDVSQVKQALTNEVATRVANGAHNLLAPYEFPEYTNGGITFVGNGDGSYTFKAGTSTGSPAGYVVHSGSLADFGLDKNTEYVLSKGTNDARDFGVVLYLYNGSTYVAEFKARTDKEVVVNMSSYTFDTLKFQLAVGNGVSFAEDTIITPLICLASDPSKEFTPYAMTNKELTDVVTALHSLGSRVDISSYNASNNKYTCPSDGYAYIQIDNDSNCSYLSMMLSGGTAATTIYKPSSGNSNSLVYVPKGMTVYFDYDNASPTKIVCRFIPIV